VGVTLAPASEGGTGAEGGAESGAEGGAESGAEGGTEAPTGILTEAPTQVFSLYEHHDRAPGCCAKSSKFGPDRLRIVHSTLWPFRCMKVSPPSSVVRSAVPQKSQNSVSLSPLTENDAPEPPWIMVRPFERNSMVLAVVTQVVLQCLCRTSYPAKTLMCALSKDTVCCGSCARAAGAGAACGAGAVVLADDPASTAFGLSRKLCPVRWACAWAWSALTARCSTGACVPSCHQ
jgi:hypothetical protein